MREGGVEEVSGSPGMNHWVVPFSEMEMLQGRGQDGWQAESLFGTYEA